MQNEVGWNHLSNSRPNQGGLRVFVCDDEVAGMLVKRIWIDKINNEPIDPLTGDTDVMIEMENGELWTAHFVTLPYLRQQIEMSIAVADSQSELERVGFVALETPHVIVEKLDQEAIEDIVDNLSVLGVFESVFDLVIDTEEDSVDQTVGSL